MVRLLFSRIRSSLGLTGESHAYFEIPKSLFDCKPQIVEEGLQDFLNEQGLKWPTPVDDVKDAERLIEVAGRCCYMSFGKKAGSKTNKRYIGNCWEGMKMVVLNLVPHMARYVSILVGVF